MCQSVVRKVTGGKKSVSTCRIHVVDGMMTVNILHTVSHKSHRPLIRFSYFSIFDQKNLLILISKNYYR